ncbi:hypothetical protein OQ483_20415 [Enterobacter bugandensis]|uniref:hypothetical protein n=1 Tax=Enterobacter bugandensis TaxID=881260 RepID=UPI00283A9546|nr:hypothetical protein [Enterobacter bugandensis]WMU72298.1 hypothetical protein OQ483_20415 [Enterobacter bugandensis]
MTHRYRIALVWGLVCFSLLYRAFPSEIFLSLKVLQQWQIPVWEQIVHYSMGILPALTPLLYFLFLTHRGKFTKGHAFMMPLIAWIAFRFALICVLWLITFKISKPPLYSEGFMDIVSTQIVRMFWNANVLDSALVILVCSYAFWREHNLWLRINNTVR